MTDISSQALLPFKGKETDMATTYYGLTDSSDFEAMLESLANGFQISVGEQTLTLEPKRAKIVATYGASTLLAASSTTLAGRKRLEIWNKDPLVSIRYGVSSANAIYEEGEEVAPLQHKAIVFEGSTDINLYVRSMGYAVNVEVMES